MDNIAKTADSRFEKADSMAKVTDRRGKVMDREEAADSSAKSNR